MGADAVHVFFGVRQVLQPEEELSTLEEIAHPRMEAARRAKLKTCIGRATDGEPCFLLMGHHLGTFGVENQVQAALTESELTEIINETKRRLQQTGLDPAEARLHFQLEAQY
jgi:hypothetical protein